MSVDGERHAHLSGRHRQSLGREDTGIGIEHFDLSFVREIDFRLVGHDGQDVARQADACVAHLETAGSHARLVFVLGTDGSVHLGQVVFGFQLFLVDFLPVFIVSRALGGEGGHGHQRGRQQEDCFLHLDRLNGFAH